MNSSSSIKAAILVFSLVAAYFGARSLLRGDVAPEAAPEEAALFTVIAQPIAAENWRAEIIVRGRTKAVRKVIVRAETSGVVEATPAVEGSQVKQGDVLCRLKVDARQAALNEARATLSKARIDHNAAVELAAEGFRSDASVAGAKAALDLARANVEQATLNLGKTKITAPFDGVYDNRAAEAGDLLNMGDPCGTVIQHSPFLISGAVSEKDIAKISVGDKGTARLATGEVIDGFVRFVAVAADPLTRTFDVELEVPNEDRTLRDGVTAEFTIFAARRDAHIVPHGALTLDNDGRIGVKSVDADDRVEFTPVTLLGETAAGIWIDGVVGETSLIVRGQDFVSVGQQVAVASGAGASGEQK